MASAAAETDCQSTFGCAGARHHHMGSLENEQEFFASGLSEADRKQLLRGYKMVNYMCLVLLRNPKLW